MALPLALGSLGLMLAGEAFLDAVFDTVTMYVLNWGGKPANRLVELARWTAPLSTAAGIVLFIRPFARYLAAGIRYLTSRDSVAVYGDHALYLALKKRCRVTEGAESLLPAHRYLFFGGEEENLDSYLRFREKLKNREVTLRCSSLRTQDVRDSRLHLFSAEETAARLFWRQADMITLFNRKGPALDVALVGFGALGEEVLTWGLQSNIFSPDQRITWHVFGSDGSFAALHPCLSQIGDPVVFYGTPWQENLPVLEKADRVLVCGQEDQLALTQRLMSVLPGKTIDVFAVRKERFSLCEDAERLRLFDWKEEALTPENIFDAATLKRAKAINLRYAHLYRRVPETPENMESEWARLDAFGRYSNISCADYHEIRLQMLRAWGAEENAASLSAERLELLGKLEHIRWCRYHFLNNWTCGDPGQGNRKDPARKIHRDLVPWAELDRGEKEKDRENIRLLLSLR